MSMEIPISTCLIFALTRLYQMSYNSELMKSLESAELAAKRKAHYQPKKGLK